MRTVEILSDFDGYPDGVAKRAFRTGDRPELADDYAELLVAKGLARDPDQAPAKRKTSKA